MAADRGSGAPPAEDLTARARIRDAAMALFGERGFKAPTIRQVAAAAGVSPGLVQHHFGTKEGLRRACDENALAILRRKFELVEDLDAELSRPGFAVALYEMGPLLLRYLMRLMVEGAPAGAVPFDEMAASAERSLSRMDPGRFPPGSLKVREAATVMLAMHLGTLVLHAQVARRVGVDMFDAEGWPRVGLAMLDVYETMGRWAASETGVRARAAVSAYLEGSVGRRAERKGRDDG